MMSVTSCTATFFAISMRSSLQRARRQKACLQARKRFRRCITPPEMKFALFSRNCLSLRIRLHQRAHGHLSKARLRADWWSGTRQMTEAFTLPWYRTFGLSVRSSEFGALVSQRPQFRSAYCAIAELICRTADRLLRQKSTKTQGLFGPHCCLCTLQTRPPKRDLATAQNARLTAQRAGL